ncbi:MAG: CDP-diacylglycerol--glycerol-3-phosphate 3-phosphatidyltransferase [Deltaproteobacteria bacterium]
MRTQSQVKNFNIPNSLSMIRIGAAPVLVFMLLAPDETMSVVSAVVFSVVCVTDWLDGYLARRRGATTQLGKFLDPLADKILITTVLIMLIPLGRSPAWIVAAMIGREIAVTGLRAIASDMGVVIAASRLGKYKTAAQIAAIVPLMIHYPFFGFDFHLVGSALLIVALGLALWSGVDYFIAFFRRC